MGFQDEVLKAIEALARQRPQLSAVDVWTTLQHWGVDMPMERRALGSAFIIARQRGWIEKSGAYDTRAPIDSGGRWKCTLWRSLLIEHKGAAPPLVERQVAYYEQRIMGLVGMYEEAGDEASAEFFRRMVAEKPSG